MNELSVEPAFTLALRDIGDEKTLAVSARELHEYLGNKDRFATWIKDRIEQYEFLEDQDFATFSENPEKGRPRIQYAISIDMAKELAMVERTVQGRIARRYFIACEKQLRERLVKDTAASLLLLPVPREWKMRFEPPYYEALAKVTGLTYTGHASGTPPLFGKITDEWVYQVVMPPGVLGEMRARRGGGQKLHQWLTDGGLDQVERQILRVMDQAESSAGYPDFRARCMRVFNKRGQLGIIYPIAA